MSALSLRLRVIVGFAVVVGLHVNQRELTDA
jgi:hypothetical protein